MSEQEPKIIKITSIEQFVEIYGQPNMPMTQIPVRVLQDWMYGPERFLDVIRANTQAGEDTEPK